MWAVSLLFFMGKGGGWVVTDGKSAGSGGGFGSNSRFPAEEQREPKQHEEDQEEHLGDHGGGAGDDTKAEDARDQGDDEEGEGVA